MKLFLFVLVVRNWIEEFRNVEDYLKSFDNCVSDNSLFLNSEKLTILLHYLFQHILPDIST